MPPEFKFLFEIKLSLSHFGFAITAKRWETPLKFLFLVCAHICSSKLVLISNIIFMECLKKTKKLNNKSWIMFNLRVETETFADELSLTNRVWNRVRSQSNRCVYWIQTLNEIIVDASNCEHSNIRRIDDILHAAGVRTQHFCFIWRINKFRNAQPFR